ncbi:MAG: hypothetical protein WBN08_07240, partial [Thiogranum sp.]
PVFQRHLSTMDQEDDARERCWSSWTGMSQPASCINSALFLKETAHIPRELHVTWLFVDRTHGEVHSAVKKARSRRFLA